MIWMTMWILLRSKWAQICICARAEARCGDIYTKYELLWLLPGVISTVQSYTRHVSLIKIQNPTISEPTIKTTRSQVPCLSKYRTFTRDTCCSSIHILFLPSLHRLVYQLPIFRLAGQ